MGKLFKTIYIPNADGTPSATVATNTNCVFVDTYKGDDTTGNGTREFPYKSITKANLKAVVTYIIFRGVINEAFTTGKTIIGDDINQILKSDVFSNTLNMSASLIRITVFRSTGLATLSNNSYIINNLAMSIGQNNSYFFILKLGLNGAPGYGASMYSSTINGSRMSANPANNGLFLDCISFGFWNILTATTQFFYKNVLFPSTTIFAYNGTPITQPTWTNSPTGNVELLRLAYIAAGMTRAVADATFVKDSFGNETCQIVLEEKNGGTLKNIFACYAPDATNRATTADITAGVKTLIPCTQDISSYKAAGDIWVNNYPYTYTSRTAAGFVGSQTMPAIASGAVIKQYGDVTDFSLNANSGNVALYASSTGGYVGALKPVMPMDRDCGNAWGSPLNVTVGGADNGAGDLLVVNADDTIVFNTASSQIWNRVRSGVIPIPNGIKFQGLTGITTDGSPFGYFFGKFQNLMDNTAVLAGTVLEANTTYKVCNPNQGTYSNISYNGTVYAPDYFFTTGASPLAFTLLNADSGSVVKKLLGTPMESVEVIPSGAFTTPFSAPLFGNCYMLFYSATGATRYGKTAGNPVLFGDLKSGTNMLADFPNVCDKISYYDTYAVTNADQEFATLATSAYFTNSIPVGMSGVQLELNAIFNEAYDQ